MPRRVVAQLERVKRHPLRLRLTIKNPSDAALLLDEPSVCTSGRPEGDVFRVTVDGKPVAYRGVMAKRGPPKSFERVEPGKAYSVVVDLSQDELVVGP
jgi:hypothetical protein